MEIDDAVRRRLADVQREFSRSPGVKWVEPENLHVTVRFFGEWPEERLRELADALGAIERPAAFRMELAGLRFFPHAEAPRVFLALGRVPAETMRYQQAIEEAARCLGFAPEKKPFIPHVTLGRIREPRQGRRLAEAVRTADRALGEAEVQGLTLFRSKLGALGPTYSALERFKFPDASGG